MDAISENKINDAYKPICDKKTIEAIEILSTVNSERADKIKRIVMEYFQETRKIVDYPQYLKLIQKTSAERQIKINRRANMLDIDDDFENLDDF